MDDIAIMIYSLFEILGIIFAFTFTAWMCVVCENPSIVWQSTPSSKIGSRAVSLPLCIARGVWAEIRESTGESSAGTNQFESQQGDEFELSECWESFRCQRIGHTNLLEGQPKCMLFLLVRSTWLTDEIMSQNRRCFSVACFLFSSHVTLLTCPESKTQTELSNIKYLSIKLWCIDFNLVVYYSISLVYRQSTCLHRRHTEPPQSYNPIISLSFNNTYPWS